MTHNTEAAWYQRLRAATFFPPISPNQGCMRSDDAIASVAVGDIREALAALQPQPSEANAELVEVLKPFADFAARIPESSPDAMCIWPSWSRDDKPIATVLDFRRAAAALRTGQQTTGHICPTCGALPKDKCTSAQGNVLPYPHAARQQGVE